MDMSLTSHRFLAKLAAGVCYHAEEKHAFLKQFPVLIFCHIHGDGIDRIRAITRRVS
jgi:hypothetical protein